MDGPLRGVWPGCASVMEAKYEDGGCEQHSKTSGTAQCTAAASQSRNGGCLHVVPKGKTKEEIAYSAASYRDLARNAGARAVVRSSKSRGSTDTHRYVYKLGLGIEGLPVETVMTFRLRKGRICALRDPGRDESGQSNVSRRPHCCM